METQREGNPEQIPVQAAAHITSAQEILKALETKIGQHPELATAIDRLEMALSILAVQTCGLL